MKNKAVITLIGVQLGSRYFKKGMLNTHPKRSRMLINNTVRSAMLVADLLNWGIK